MNELARLMAGLPHVVENLLARHIPDAQGRCTACTKPGTGIPDKEWPCALHWYATEARSEGWRL